jgi:tRNA modification GTPase
VRLFDTAGLRDTSDVVEAAGIERTKDIGEEADVLLYVVDSSVGMTEKDYAFVKEAKVPVVLVYNKSDVKGSSVPQDALAVSAKQNVGIDALVKKVVSLSGAGSQSAGDAEAGLGSDRQRAAVQEALDRVTHALEVSALSYSLDAVVQDLEDSLDSLGEITGEVVADDILESIFSNFCVGK